jgi:hypothetical protein
MTQFSSQSEHESKVINGLEGLSTTLKILGRVILSCQFKSGPGHQPLKILTTYVSKRDCRPNCRETQKESFGAASDTLLTHTRAGGR